MRDTISSGLPPYQWTPRVFSSLLDEFIAAFRVFDKEKSGMIGAGELKYILTELGEKMSEEEVQELMNATQMGAYVRYPLLPSHRDADVHLYALQKREHQLRKSCTTNHEHVTYTRCWLLPLLISTIHVYNIHSSFDFSSRESNVLICSDLWFNHPLNSMGCCCT